MAPPAAAETVPQFLTELETETGRNLHQKLILEFLKYHSIYLQRSFVFKSPQGGGMELVVS